MMREIFSERQMMCQIRGNTHLVIYGAGMVGELTVSRLVSLGFGEKIMGFAVSNRQKNPRMGNALCGLPVYDIHELVMHKKDAVVIVATLPNLHEEIGKVLLELRFENIVFVTQKLYQVFTKNHIADYKMQHSLKFAENAKYRILFMASDNNNISGAFRCMVELCDMLQKSKVAVAVVLPHYGSGAWLLSQRNIPYTYVLSQDWGYETAKERNLLEKMKFMAGMLRNQSAKKELRSIIENYSVDLIHCNTTYTYIGALAARDCGIPIVWHLREHMEDQGFRIFSPRWGWRLIRQSDHVITVSEYIRSLMPLKGKEDVSVVYDTVEMEGQTYIKRDILQHKIVRMIIVGVIIRHKRQKELIDACVILKQKGFLDFHLTMVGRGTEKYINELKQTVTEYELGEFISFYGVSDQVSELYAQSDIAFMCSVAEPYGRVTVEAQMSGCLVIGSDSGATPELIREGETGYLYEAGNPEALADKIIEAVRYPQISRRIARAGQEYAHKTYTKERNVREIMDIYENVLERRVR